MTQVAGLNLKGRVWRFTTPSDDDQGGAVPTGTILYEPVFSRISAQKPTMAILEQGINTIKLFTGMLSYTAYSPTGSFNVQENDIYEVTHPPISHYYGQRFVIIGTQWMSFSDSRRYLQVTLRREEQANSNLLQA